MAYVVVMPRLGQTMEVGEIVEWRKAEGDTVEKGEVLLSVSRTSRNSRSRPTMPACS